MKLVKLARLAPVWQPSVAGVLLASLGQSAKAMFAQDQTERRVAFSYGVIRAR